MSKTSHTPSAFLRGLLLLLALAALSSACDDGGRPASSCPTTCPCTEDGCAPGWCGARITLEPGCAETSPSVEIYAAGCLEPDNLTLAGDGTPAVRVACGAIAENETGDVVVRSEAIQWGPFEVDCPDGGGLLYPVSLSCP